MLSKIELIFDINLFNYFLLFVCKLCIYVYTYMHNTHRYKIYIYIYLNICIYYIYYNTIYILYILYIIYYVYYIYIVSYPFFLIMQIGFYVTLITFKIFHGSWERAEKFTKVTMVHLKTMQQWIVCSCVMHFFQTFNMLN